jgi:hypothetical protein
MEFHFHGNLHVQQIQIQLPAAPAPAPAPAPEEDGPESSPEIDVQVEWHAAAPTWDNLGAAPPRTPSPRTSPRTQRAPRTQQLLERLRETHRAPRTPVGALLDMMQPYQSLLQESGIHELFNAAQETSATGTPTHPLILQHLAYADPPGGDECSICTEASENRPWTKLEPCGHQFHRSCSRTWLTSHNTCPLCRRTVRLDTAQFSLHELLELRSTLGLPRSEVVERNELERQLQEHVS